MSSFSLFIIQATQPQAVIEQLQLLPEFQQLSLTTAPTQATSSITRVELAGNINYQQLNNAVKKFAHTTQQDMLLLKAPIVEPKLLVMDMDSTLVKAETIDQIALVAGEAIGRQVAEVTERAMRGELDFEQSLRERVAKLKGIDRALLNKVHQRLPLMPGAKQLIDGAKSAGCYIALVSGGFNYFAKPLAEQLGIDEAHANELEFADDALTGKVQGTIVDAQFKAEQLQRLTKRLGLSDEQVIAIGDGANDLPMLSAAGSGFAFHAKPKVQQQAELVINHADLSILCELYGWR